MFPPPPRSRKEEVERGDFDKYGLGNDEWNLSFNKRKKKKNQVIGDLNVTGLTDRKLLEGSHFCLSVLSIIVEWSMNVLVIT